jgi:hypothetical protein
MLEFLKISDNLNPIRENGVITVDNFYSNYIDIRQQIMNIPFKKQPYSHAPGLDTNSFATPEHICKKLSEIAEDDNAYNDFKDGYTFFRQQVEGDDNYHIHWDGTWAWVGLVYLSEPPSNPFPGSIFWKHKVLGISEYPRNAQHLSQNYMANIRHKIFDDHQNYAKWEKLAETTFKPNRLIMFKGYRLHGGGPSWGNNQENCRMLQIIFPRMIET